MNTYYRIKIRSPKENNLLHNSIKKELQRINEEMSVFDANSEISIINRDDTGEWIELSPEMSTVMKTAYNVYNTSNGYFDPTVGRLVDLWGFGTNKSPQKVPDDKTIKEAEQHFEGANYGKLKAETAEAVVETLKPVQDKFNYYMTHKDEMYAIAKQGVEKVAKYATNKVDVVKEKMGLICPK